MTQRNPHISRRTVFRTIAGTALASLAGCLSDGSGTSDNGADPLDSQDLFEHVAVEGTELVVELSAEAEVDQINLIKPNGELFGQREVATGSQQVSFELRTTYTPGEYRVIGLNREERVADIPTEIRPEIQIQDVGLFRNNPDKPWDDIYGDTETDRLKNGEVFVTVANTGTGPEAIVKLVFSGDVPNPIENPQQNGIYKTERVVLSPGEETDLFSNSFPFGSASETGMGCSPDTNHGQFTVTIDTRVGNSEVANSYSVEYTGSHEMSDCVITIAEA